MRSRIGSLFFGIMLATALAGVAVMASTTTVTNGTITITYPNYPLRGPALLTCEPGLVSEANTIQISGIPEGASVQVIFTWASPYGGSPTLTPSLNYTNVTGGSLVVPVSYPSDSSAWPSVDPTTNERSIQVNALVMVTYNGTTMKLTTKGWWIKCPATPAPKQGCTPGYWRQDQHFDSWVPTGYAPGDDFNTVFSVSATFNPHTLLDAVWLGGGGENALARHAVAALLNAANPDVNYAYAVADVISMVQAAYASGDFEPTKNLFDFANNAGCPLN